jgi:hypothetical protein
MKNIKNLLDIISFSGKCPYRDFPELELDAESLLTEKQKLKLQCIRNIAVDIKNNEEQ